MKNNLATLQQLASELPRSRIQFIRDVEMAATHAVNIARQIAPAIGEISITEAKAAIVREFEAKLNGE